ncbi:MAG: DNA polymerase I, partial [Actinobacteria bacterium]|nr:DNA polymerase I [Actinomycetota bacterium]
MSTLMLIDGNSLTYRAFFALPTDMATASGQVTNAVYGFTSMLVNLLRDQRPDHLAVVFDRPEPTFRHLALDSYKANREASPDILRQQMGLVRQVVEVLRVPVLDLAGFEADDIIATLATQAEARGDDVVIVTGDRDSYQLVCDPHIRVLYNKRGVSDYALYDEAGIVERTGVTPAQYPDYAALRGDSSDNLPGVPGIGEKTAAALINAYGDLEGIFEHVDELKPKQRATLPEWKDRVFLNRKMSRLELNVDVPYEPAQLRMGHWDHDRVRELFNQLEFRSLLDRMVAAVGDRVGAGAGTVERASLDVDVTPVHDAQAAAKVFADLAKQQARYALEARWLGVPGRSHIDGLGIA